MEQLLIKFTLFTCRALIETGVIPAPKTEEDARVLLDNIYLDIVEYLVNEGVLVPNVQASPQCNTNGSTGN